MIVSFKKLDNGLTIATDFMDNLESISLKIRVGVGGCYEKKEERGISHFIEHMAFKGTPNRDKVRIATELDELGGHFNAYTSKEHTAYHCTVPKIFIDDAFEILADIILNPLYQESEIELERGVIIQEIGMYEDSPQDKLSEEYYKISFADQAFGDSILGPVENIRNFKRDDFLKYINRFYKKNNIIIAAAGNISLEKIEALTNKWFGDDRDDVDIPEPEKAYFTGGECRIEKSDLEQIQIIMGFEGVKKDLEMDFFKIDITSSILGGGMSSRLFQEIRENRGLAYSVSAWHSAYSHCGLFSIYGGVEPSKANVFIEESINEMKKMRDFVTEEELERVKKQSYCSILIGTDGTGSRVNHLISSLSHYGRYVDVNEIIEKINAVTLDDVKKSIDFILNSDRKTLASIGKLENNVMKIDEFKNLING